MFFSGCACFVTRRIEDDYGGPGSCSGDVVSHVIYQIKRKTLRRTRDRYEKPRNPIGRLLRLMSAPRPGRSIPTDVLRKRQVIAYRCFQHGDFSFDLKFGLDELGRMRGVYTLEDKLVANCGLSLGHLSEQIFYPAAGAKKRVAASMTLQFR